MSEVMEINATEAIENIIDRSRWTKWKFSDLVNNIVEKVVPKDSGLDHYIGLKHLDTGSLKIRRFGETQSLIGNKLKIYKGDLIFAKRNAYLKRVAIADFDAVASAHSMVLRPNPENVLTEFLPFFLLSEKFWQRAIEISVGSLSPTINWKVLAKQEFLLPPKDQQAQLAKLLWAMDEVIEKEKEVLEKLDINKRSFEKKNLLKYNSKIEIDLPEGYKIFKLSEISDITGGSTPSRNNKEYWGGEIPWLTPTDVTNHDKINLSITKEFITESGLKNISNRLYPPGTILYCSRATIGYAIINDVPMATNQGFSNFLVNEKTRNYFLYFLLKHLTPELTRLAGGSTFLEISKSSIRNFKVIIPPLMIQKKLENMLIKLENSRISIKSKIETSQSLQKSLINQVF